MFKRPVYIGRRPSAPATPALSGPDWAQANPKRIAKALKRALALPSGGWYVAGASREVRGEPEHHRIAGRDLVIWRDADEQVRSAPEACPHMGASLACARVDDSKLVCPWHGLALGPEGHGSWRHFPTHDDGVLTWVRLDDAADTTDRPVLAPRPMDYIDAVIRVDADCEPSDVIANRLDPWHGVHFHPHSFSTLAVTRADEDVLQLRVAFRLLGPLSVEVDATFHCPEPRTIVMTIVDGDGIGSVVETHATPIEPGRTAIIEATLASSDRAGFAWSRRIAPVVRYYMKRSATKLWADDAAYAERRYWLRRREEAAGQR